MNTTFREALIAAHNALDAVEGNPLSLTDSEAVPNHNTEKYLRSLHSSIIKEVLATGSESVVNKAAITGIKYGSIDGSYTLCPQDSHCVLPTSYKRLENGNVTLDGVNTADRKGVRAYVDMTFEQEEYVYVSPVRGHLTKVYLSNMSEV